MGQIVLIAAKDNSATRMIVEGGGGTRAEPGTRYILKSAAGGTLVDPVTLKRDGNDLLVFLGSETTAELTLLDYFKPGMSAQLYGVDDNGQPRAYASTGTVDGHLQLQDGESTRIALDGPTMSDAQLITASHDNSAGLTAGPFLAGAGALAILAASKHSWHSGHHSAEAPKVTITRLIDKSHGLSVDIAANGRSDDTRPEIVGTGTVNANISIYDGNILLGSTTVRADGTWTFIPAQALTLETHNIIAIATDAAGRASQPTPAFVVTITAEPSIQQEYWPSSISGPVADGSLTDNGTPTLSGKTKPDSIVKLSDNHNELGSVVTDHDGYWSFTLTTPLSAGEHVIIATVASVRGEPPIHAYASYSLTVDYSPQVAITHLIDRSHGLTVDIAANGKSDDTRPEIVGTGTVNATISIYDGNILLGSTTVRADGTWSFTPAQALQQNSQSIIYEDLTKTPHSITAVASDAAGHTSLPTDAFVFTVMVGMPSVTDYPWVAITGMVNDLVPFQGDIQPGGSTDNAKPEIIGTGKPHVTITIYDGSSLLGTTTVQGDGTWTFTPPQALTLGTHSITAIATGAGGGLSQATKAFVVTIITEPNISQQYWPSSISGPAADGGLTDNGTPTLNGKTKPDSIVKLSDNQNELGSAVTDHDGYWSFTLTAPLSAGKHVIIATVDSAPGEQSIHAYASYSLAVDYSPQVAITQLIDDFHALTVDISANGSTRDTRLEVIDSGTAQATTLPRGGTSLAETTTPQGDEIGAFATPNVPPPDTYSLIATNTAGYALSPTDALVIGALDAPKMEPLPPGDITNSVAVDRSIDHSLAALTSAAENIQDPQLPGDSMEPGSTNGMADCSPLKPSLEDLLATGQVDLPWFDNPAPRQDAGTNDRPESASGGYGYPSNTWLQSLLSAELPVQQE
ncbi:Ig-like domain-containing protein [Pseudomonas pseudonitroreducens]|uniref:Ig-like domain-containing protein n=1 Tax=Pseudomonas pseudonitroreducens TaxID=2892326 RepID=UPI001F3EAEC5|nr:Ig-like domain-containing protein [Pseudomonas pseudonitroreducens]